MSGTRAVVGALRVLFGAAALVGVVGVLAWPLWRLWRQTGRFGITFVWGTGGRAGLLRGALAVVLAGWALGWGRLMILGALPGTLVLWHWGLYALGVGMTLGGAVVIARAQWEMGASWRIGLAEAPTALVTEGLYRFVRNPIYAGVLLALGGLVVACPTVPMLLAWGATYAVLRGVSAEEARHLTQVHGTAYRAWASGRGRFWPRRPPV